MITTSRRADKNSEPTAFVDKGILAVVLVLQGIVHTAIHLWRLLFPFIGLGGRKPQRVDNQANPTDSTDRKSLASVLSFKSVLGTVIGLCGFVVQFVGLRGMHFSASIAQLTAVVIMTCLRSWVRRGLATPPQCTPLPSGFELEWFATALGDPKSAPWLNISNSENEVKEGKDTGQRRQTCETLGLESEGRDSKPSHIGDSESHNMMLIRRDLGRLAQWHGPPSAEANALARAIQVTMDTLFGSDFQNTWQFDAGYAKSDAQPIYVRLIQNKGKWKAHLREIEAVLSLRLYFINDEEKVEHQHQHHTEKQQPPGSQPPEDATWPRAETSLSKGSLRLLGHATPALRRDLEWWVPRDIGRVIGAEEDGEGMLEVASHRVVSSGFSPETTLQTPGDNPQKYRTQNMEELNFEESGKLVNAERTGYALLATESYDSLKLVYAQDMFSSFMWAVAKMLTAPVEGGADLIRPIASDSNDAWNSVTLRNARLSKMAQEIYATGLGSLDQVYLSIIPPLSVERKLPPANVIVDLAREQAKPHEQLQRWKAAGDVYLWLFRTAKTFEEQTDIAAGAKTTPLEQNGVTTRATAVLMEYLRMVTETIELRQNQHYNEADISNLKMVQSSLQKELEGANQQVLSNLSRLYRIQGRPWSYRLVKDTEPTQDEDAVLLQTFHFTQVHLLARSNIWSHSGVHPLDTKDLNPKDIHDWTPLHYAAVGENKIVFRELLQRRADVNAKDLLEWTPLHYACQHDAALFVQEIIREGADIDARGRDGIAPLHCAAMSGHLDVVRTLMKAGATADILDGSGNTPLVWAAVRGHKLIIEYLWPAANKLLRDHNGRTALHMAVMAEMVEVVEWFVNPGTDKDTGAHTNAKDSIGRTPLHYAARSGHSTTVQLLFEDPGINPDAKDHDGRTPLHDAAGGSHASTVKLLVKLGANTDAKDSSGRTALHDASGGGHADIVNLLVDLGAHTDVVDQDGQTPLYYAVVGGHAGTIKLLVGLDADTDAKDNNGRTGLHYAVGTGDTATAKLLVELGAETNVKDRFGGTPLHYAAGSGDADTVKLLIERPGTNTNTKDRDERTALHYAAWKGHTGTVKLLVERGTNMDVKDHLKRTPLHYAAGSGHTSIVELLVKLGADTDTKDHVGRTPLSDAQWGDYTDIVQLLTEPSADRGGTDDSQRLALRDPAVTVLPGVVMQGEFQDL